MKSQYLSCERCLRSSYFHDVILEFLTHNYRYLCEKKTSVRKLIVIFKAFWTCSSMVSIKITCYYIFMLKIEINMWKTPTNHIFLHCFRLKFENFQNWIQRFDIIFKKLSDAVFGFRKFQLHPEIYWKNLKNPFSTILPVSETKEWIDTKF